jgi:hypothetical protein
MIPLVVPWQWATAEAASAWSTPTVLFQTSGYTSNPVLVPDSTGDVHLVFWVSEKKAFTTTSASVLMYARLHQGTWSSAVDVLTSPDGGQLKQPAAALDSAGFLHVVFVAGTQGDVYYSRVHVSQADQIGAWTRPALLSLSAASNGAFGVPAAIDESDGTLHFVYTSREGRLVYRRSDDGGISWGSAVTLSDNGRAGGAADDPRLITDRQGRIFVSWSQYQLPAGWPPIGTYMSMSPDNGTTWSPGLRVSGENRALLNVASSGTGQLYRLWLSIGEVGEKKGQFSNDGGETWSVPESVAPSLAGGLTGFPPMAYDSSGVLHIAPSATGASKNGIYHLTWDGRSWSQPTFVSKGAVGRSSVELPAMAVSRGNQIHIVYEDDFERIWYTSQLSNAPQVIARPVPAPPLEAPVPSPSVAATATPRPTPTPLPAYVPAMEQDSAEPQLDTSSDLRRVFLTAAAPVVLILGGLIVQRLRRIV